MLGAKARAAEYNAFKAASARQASREAEEQSVPLQSVPVSLSAFTRSTQVNRNKGTKNWIPLVLDDTEEEEQAFIDHRTQSTPESTRQISMEDDLGTITDSNCSSGGMTYKKIRVNIPEVTIPIAPKAMMAASNRTTSMVEPTLQRMQHRSGIVSSTIMTERAVSTSPENHYFDGLYGTTTHNKMERFDGYMLPTDISPTKQEEKFARISHMNTTNLSDSQHPLPKHFKRSATTTEIPTPCQLHEFDNLQSFKWTANGSPHHSSYQNLQASQPHTLPYFVSEPRAIDHRPSIEGVTTRYGSMPKVSSTPIDQLRSSYPTVQPEYELGTSPTLRPAQSEQQYDKNSKMRSFMAAQEALAKTGKTVLHNPGHRHVEISEESTTFSEDGFTPVISRDSLTKASDNGCRFGNIGVLIQDPSQHTPKLSNTSINQAQMCSIDPFDPEILPQKTQKFPPSWYELKPMTSIERQDIQVMFQRAAFKMTVNDKNFSFCEVSLLREAEAIDWLHTDGRGLQAIRKKVEEISDQYCSKRAHLSGQTDMTETLIDKPEVWNVQWGSITAMGHVMVNVFENQAQESLPGASKDYFSGYKVAPEFAIEKSGVLGRNSKSQSYFEDDKIGFYNAPVRIARDPRFLHQGKEERNIKVEDKWSNYHDMYSRRRLL